jgi:hypothetical protein
LLNKLTEPAAVVEYQVWKHFGLGFGINRFGIDLDAEDTADNERISFDTNYNGRRLYTLFSY